MALEQRIAAFPATCGLLGWKFLFVATGTPLCFSLLFLRAQLDRTDFFVDDFRVTLGCEFRAEKLAVDEGEDTWSNQRSGWRADEYRFVLLLLEHLCPSESVVYCVDETRAGVGFDARDFFQILQI